MPALVHGSYLLAVTHEDKGYAKNEINMNNVLKITGISPTTGSQWGTRLTVSGNGFPTSGVVINFGDSNKYCSIITTTPTSITCISDARTGALDV
jgi:hypothetical protein